MACPSLPHGRWNPHHPPSEACVSRSDAHRHNAASCVWPPCCKPRARWRACHWVRPAVSSTGNPTFAHPNELTPDGRVLVAVSTADAPLEALDLSGGTSLRRGSVPVGLDPASVLDAARVAVIATLPIATATTTSTATSSLQEQIPQIRRVLPAYAWPTSRRSVPSMTGPLDPTARSCSAVGAQRAHWPCIEGDTPHFPRQIRSLRPRPSQFAGYAPEGWRAASA